MRSRGIFSLVIHVCIFQKLDFTFEQFSYSLSSIDLIFSNCNIDGFITVCLTQDESLDMLVYNQSLSFVLYFIANWTVTDL